MTEKVCRLIIDLWKQGHIPAAKSFKTFLTMTCTRMAGLDLHEWDTCDGCEAICLHSMVCEGHTAAANGSTWEH